jgi:hypothetical protein
VADEAHPARGGSGAGWLAGCGIVAGANLGCFLPLMLAAFFFVGYMSVNGLTPGSEAEGGDQVVAERVPDSLKPIFEQGAAKHGVSANLIAAIFGYGEHCQQRRGDSCLRPGFPTGGPWASNSDTNASGPFQFMECTWEGWNGCNKDGQFSTDLAYIQAHGGMGEDCDGDGRADVQNLTDASCSAGRHLSGQAKGAFTESAGDLQKIYDAAYSYNHASWYAKGVQQGYLQLLRGAS